MPGLSSGPVWDIYIFMSLHVVLKTSELSKIFLTYTLTGQDHVWILYPDVGTCLANVIAANNSMTKHITALMIQNP